MNDDRRTIIILVLACLCLLFLMVVSVISLSDEETKRKSSQENLNWLAKEFACVNAANLKLAQENAHLMAYSFHHVMSILIYEAGKLEIPINVASALIQIESDFDPDAISETGDHGLFQINLATWQKVLNIDPTKIYKPENNIKIGLKILRKCYERAGSWSMALALYNAGKNYRKSGHPAKFQKSGFMK